MFSCKKEHEIHDRLVKNILKDKEEIIKFINQFITKSNYISNENLVKYTNSFITKRYKTKGTDLVYKIKNQNIFFLIEHQSQIDNSITYRMLNYCIDIMNEWKKSQKTVTIKKYPVIIPIVIYTGDKKWKIPVNLKEKQIATSIFENYKIDFRYNLIDTNKLTDKGLIEKNSMLGYFMMIEKSKDKKELLEKLKIIVEKEEREEILRKLEDIIIYYLNNALENTSKEELLPKINIEVGDEKVSTLVERLTEENKRVWNNGIAKGLSKNKKAVAKKMLEKDFNDEMIIEIVKITEKELEELKIQTNNKYN